MWNFNAKKITVFMSAAVVFAVLLLGSFSCGQNETEEVGVGVVVPLTGPLSSNGLQMKNGMELALGEINGSPLLGGKEIRFIIEDSEGTPDGAERAYRKLIEQDGVVAVLGPFTSSATERIIPVAQQNGVVAFSPTSAARGLSARSEFAFRASLTVDPLVQSGVVVTREQLRYNNVATIVNEADAFSSSNHEKVKEELEKHGVRVVSEQTYSRPTGALPDLTSQLTDIINAVPPPEALFISALAPGRRGVMTQARRLGMDMNVPFLITLATQDDVREAADAAEGAITFTTWIADIDTPENRRFLKNFRAKYGEPDAFAALSYASTYILAEAIADASSIDPEAIRDAMADIRADTLLGEFYFDRYGDAVYEPIVGIVENGRFKVFGQ
ncbi:MAG: ABC transporter substrate-binding protein [Candidatus Dadabacteria bacterium]|nr:ABC transporter substrate-binding protein [Candidatus Dadabacteria bacterium]